MNFTAEDYKGPKEFVHLHNHTVFSALDGVATPEQYAEQCHKRGYPAMSATEHGHMASVPDMYLAFKKYGVKYIAGCFLPGQRVLTGDGVSAIEELVVDQYVITDQNRRRKIKNLQVRDYTGDVVRVKAWGVEEIVATPEHPFLVREVTRTEGKRGCWSETVTFGMRKISDVKREKYWRTYASKRSKDRTNKRRYRFYLCVPRLQDNEHDLEAIDLTEWISTDNKATFSYVGGNLSMVHDTNELGMIVNRPVDLPKIVMVDDDLLWIMGLWLAEGTARHGGLSFWLCDDEFEFYQRIADYFAQFGINTSYSFRKDRHSLDVTVNSTHFANIFTNMFGKGFANKRIPWWMISDLNTAQTKILVDGVFDGDAKIGTDQSYLKLNNESLVWQVRLLMTRLGQHSAITPIKCNNSDNISYAVRRRESGHFYYDYDDRYIYLPVYDVQREQYDGKVYNMEVDEDNTYNVGVAVHNCEIYYNDYELERQNLAAAGTKLKSLDWKTAHQELSSRINRNRHLTVLCKNEVGFHNLVKLTTQAYRTGLYGAGRTQYNRIWFDKLCEHKEGLIILSGCLNGPVAHELRFGNLKDKEGNITFERNKKSRIQDAVKYVKKFKEAFGEDYFIELQMPGVEDDDMVFRELIGIADHYKLPLVLANDCHYLNRKDFILQKIMMATAQDLTIDSPDLFHVNSDEQYMKTRAELWERFKNNTYSHGIDDLVFETMCDNTLLIAERCRPFEMDPSPKIPEVENADNLLKELTMKKMVKLGLHKIAKRFNIDGREVTYVEQANIELRRFIDKGFSSYFLITQDLINHGREQGWPFSPRGSAGGSLVCFLLGIHTLDPMLWELSFDRFLSPSRGGYMLNLALPEAA